MSTADEMLSRAEALREVADRERDETVALLCRTLAEAYQKIAAERPPPLRRLH